MLPRETGQALPQGTRRAAVDGAVRPGGDTKGPQGPADARPLKVLGEDRSVKVCLVETHAGDGTSQ